MPQTTEQHGNHGVHIGINVATFPWGSKRGNYSGQSNSQNDDRNNPGSAEDECRNGDDANPEPCAERNVTVASERDVEIGLQPSGKGNVPAFPEVTSILSLVGRIEVLWQVESHH